MKLMTSRSLLVKIPIWAQDDSTLAYTTVTPLVMPYASQRIQPNDYHFNKVRIEASLIFLDPSILGNLSFCL